MGCGGSKLDELEAVSLCRERSNLLSEAISFRYALADSTVAYARSLSAAGESLRSFLSSIPGETSPSPLLPLPAQRKGDALPQAAAAASEGGGRERTMGPAPTAVGGGAAAQARHSHSGSHIHFSDDDSDEDDDEDDSHIHSTDSSPIHLHHGHNEPPPSHFTYNYASAPPPAAVSVEQRPAVAPTAVHYARNTPAPTAVYERHPQSPELAPSYYGYPSSSYGAYPEQSEQSYSYTPYQPNYAAAAAAYGGGGFFGGPASPPPSYPPYASGIGGGRSPPPPRTPPPPPSPPKTSTWDFLNPFGGYESFAEEIRYPYTSSRSSREVREEEGIPDLEDEEHEVVKEAYGDGDGRFSTSTSASTTPDSISKASGKGEASGVDGEDLHYNSGKLGKSEGVGEDPHYTSGGKSGKSGEASSSGAAEVEPHVVDKDVVAAEIKPLEPKPQQQQHNVRAVASPTRYHDMSEVVEEINKQFDRASKSFDEVKKMLEVGKIPYNQKSSVIEVSTRIMCGLPSSSHSKDQFLEFEEDNVMSSGNLSSTLRKLYLWEQKLYEEVKVEEKMRIVLERECEHLRRLDEKGAEAHKIESTQIFIRKLSTKIRIAIQVVESISNKISKLRDEELWPQINEFIQGMMRMWRVMLECHRIQCQAISDATIAPGGRLNETHRVATKNLELDLLDLTTCFSAWIGTQKTFVKSLNGWLLKGLRYVPEETDDGVAPFSPGRLGAPPVFVICNYWSQTLDRISEREALDAMKVFASSVLGLWEQHHIEQRQRLRANQDMDKALRVVEIEEQQMRRAVEAKNKRLELVSGQGGLMLSGQEHRGQTVEMSSLYLNLRQFFEAMENFTANSLKAYEELHARSEEEKAAGGNSRAR